MVAGNCWQLAREQCPEGTSSRAPLYQGQNPWSSSCHGNLFSRFFSNESSSFVDDLVQNTPDVAAHTLRHWGPASWAASSQTALFHGRLGGLLNSGMGRDSGSDCKGRMWKPRSAPPQAKRKIPRVPSAAGCRAWHKDC